MIVRIVKMVFRPDKVEDFKKLFEERKEKIRAFPGCAYLELLQGIENKAHVFMTYSYWKNPEDLTNYRHSELFAETWKITKSYFSEPAEAISLHKEHRLD